MAVVSFAGWINRKENVVGVSSVFSSDLQKLQKMVVNFGTALQTAFPAVAAYSFLVFNLCHCSLFAAMGTIRRDRQYKVVPLCDWIPVLTFTFVSLCIFQIGTLITAGTFGIGTVRSLCTHYRIPLSAVEPYKESNTLNVKYLKNVVKSK